MLSLRRSDTTMDLASSAPAKKASHFPVNQTHHDILVNNTVRGCQIVMHETHIQVMVCA